MISKSTNLYDRPILGKCFKYGLPGNCSSDCRATERKVNLTLREDEYDEEEENNEDNDGEEDDADMCHLESYSGSTENIISRDIVQHLKLPIEKHPTPKYKDEVVSEIVDIDACHILLGRPWEFDEQVEDLLKKGLIQENMSPCAVLALLVPKKDGSWRICVDRRAITKIIIAYHFPITRLNDMLDMLEGSKIFSKIDLRSGYHQIRIRPGDKWKMTFKTKDDLYECYSKSEKEHLRHLHEVLIASSQNKLHINLKKCNFLTKKLLFLGFIITSHGIRVDEEKVQRIKEWPKPQEVDHSLAQIKGKLTSTPLLALINFDKLFILECDTSMVGIGVVLSQEGKPVAFFNEKLSEARQKWSTYELEFYAIYRSHKADKQNKGADALSRRAELLVTLKTKVIEFEHLKYLFAEDDDFKQI
ncbi:transposon ty3-I gag-pol polyprotein [Tanacetum coccineum]